MRIVFLSVNDEFAGKMQKPVYERHPEWVVGWLSRPEKSTRKTKFQLYFLLSRSQVFFTSFKW